jgi:hypothetical protein
MDVDKISPEVAHQILKNLITQGSVDENVIERALLHKPSLSMKYLVEAVHALFCKKSHNTEGDITEDVCFFYEYGDEWDTRDRQLWIRRAIINMNTYDLKETEALTLLNQGAGFLKDIHSINPKLLPVIRDLIDVNYVRQPNTVD